MLKNRLLLSGFFPDREGRRIRNRILPEPLLIDYHWSPS